LRRDDFPFALHQALSLDFGERGGEVIEKAGLHRGYPPTWKKFRYNGHKVKIERNLLGTAAIAR
jgi:hypothetical protein